MNRTCTVGDIVKANAEDEMVKDMLGVIISIDDNHTYLPYYVYFPQLTTGDNDSSFIPGEWHLVGKHCRWMDYDEVNLIQKRPRIKNGDTAMIIEPMSPGCGKRGEVGILRSDKMGYCYFLETDNGVLAGRYLEETLVKIPDPTDYPLSLKWDGNFLWRTSIDGEREGYCEICHKWTDEIVRHQNPIDTNMFSKYYGLSADMDATSMQKTLNDTYNDLLSTHINGKQPERSLMSRLCDIPKRIKALLSKGDRALYQVGWIDEDLDITPAGTSELLDLLYEQHKEALGELAIKKAKAIKKDEEEV